ncbi:MAG TPA: hypothetical protein VF599_00145 [Pyrinomonadaceae bacterium]|jgi:hypothetical protein
MKKIIKYGLTAAAIFLATAGFASAQNCRSKRIAVPRTSKTLTLKGTTGGCNDFLIRLRRAERLSINLTSTKGNAYFHFDTKQGLEGGGDFLCEDCTSFNEKISRSGDWIISVFHGTFPRDKGATNYTLRITLK